MTDTAQIVMNGVSSAQSVRAVSIEGTYFCGIRRLMQRMLPMASQDLIVPESVQSKLATLA